MTDIAVGDLVGYHSLSDGVSGYAIVRQLRSEKWDVWPLYDTSVWIDTDTGASLSWRTTRVGGPNVYRIGTADDETLARFVAAELTP